MMCHYHQEPAVWACDECIKQYGECCVPPMPEKMDDPLCVLCGKELRYLGMVNSMKPFWARINDFFLYPIRVSSLVFLVVSSLLMLAASYTGPVALVLGLVVACAMTKYSLQVIELMSEGEWAPPTVMEGFSGEGFSLFFKQIAILFLMGLSVYFVAKLQSMTLVIGSVAFFLLALPASMMVLAREGSVFSAVNPIRLLVVMSSIGWPYLLLYFFLVILYGAPGYFFSGHNGDQLNGPFMAASIFVSGYFSLVMCSMMGYCLFQFQEKLGYVAEVDSEVEYSEEEYYLKKALSDSAVFIREGREQEALKLLQGVISQHGDDVELSRRYHRLLVITGDDESLLSFAETYLRRLLVHGKGYEAADVYLSILPRIPGYKPDDPGDRFRLATALREKGRFHDGVRLLLNLHRQFPAYKGIPEAYLLAARIFSEGLGDDGKAVKLLDYVANKYPRSSVYEEVRLFRSVLKELA